MVERRFRYGASLGTLAIALSFFAACGALFVYLAGASVEVRLWPLPVMVRGVPVYGLAAICFAFVGIGVAQIVRSRALGPREIILGEGSLEAPRSPWTAKTIRVERTSIRDVRETVVMGTRVVEIRFDGGKLALSNRTVGDDGYRAVVDWLSTRR